MRLRSAVVAVALGLAVVASATAPVVPAGALGAGPVDPGVAGSLAVDELHYNLGATAFAPDGFPGRVELEGQVYAPRTISGRAPVVIVLHGRHVTCATDEATDLRWPCPADLPSVPSYRGYATLGRNLASHGMVVVSIGANGVNAADGYLADGGAAARAELVLAHLRILRDWDAGRASGPWARFGGHLALDHVGLVGHSRGGEGVVAAAALNQRIGAPFGIRAVVALAPVDFGRRLLGGVPLAVVLPYCDGDVSDLQGLSFFDDARYASPGDPAPKMTALVYGANHNFFNSVWTSGPGSGDDTDYYPIDQEPAAMARTDDPCQAGSPQRLSARAQDQAGATLLAGFLRRHLHDDVALQPFVTGSAPFPASVGPARWSVAHLAPDRLDVARWDSPDQLRTNRAGQLTAMGPTASGLVCVAAESLTVPVDTPMPTECPGTPAGWAPHQTSVLDVSWVRSGAVVREPLSRRGTDVTRFDGIRFRVALPPDGRNAAHQDLTVVLEDAGGRRGAVAVGALTNALVRTAPSVSRHSVLNGVRVPLSRFRGVDLHRIRAVELRFDRTPSGRLWVADLAFTAESVGAATGPVDGPSAVPERSACQSSAADAWACRVAQVAWGRDPIDEERTILVAASRTDAGRRAMVAQVVAGEEATALRALRFIQRYAQVGLSRDDLPPYLPSRGRRTWETDIALLADELVGTTARLPSTDAALVAAYETIAGRTPTSAERRGWSPRVEQHGIGVLVRALQGSASVRGRVVDERYREVLGRAPSAGERSAWVARMGGPGGEQRLLTALLGSAP